MNEAADLRTAQELARLGDGLAGSGIPAPAAGPDGATSGAELPAPLKCSGPRRGLFIRQASSHCRMTRRAGSGDTSLSDPAADHLNALTAQLVATSRGRGAPDRGWEFIEDHASTISGS
jgi:hypothetical protein